MKTNIKLTMVGLVMTILSCVKENKDLIPKEMFEVKTKGQLFTSSNFTANNISRFTVDLNLAAAFDVDDGKSLTVSVSDGSVNTSGSFASGDLKSQTTLTLVGSRASFYFFPGSKPTLSGILSITIQGIVQSIDYTISKKEPTDIQLGLTSQKAFTEQTLTISSILLTNSSELPSENLIVHFSAVPIGTVSAGGIFEATDLATSYLDASSGKIMAKKNLVLNENEGMFEIRSWYITDNNLEISSTNTITVKAK